MSEWVFLVTEVLRRGPGQQTQVFHSRLDLCTIEYDAVDDRRDGPREERRPIDCRWQRAGVGE